MRWIILLCSIISISSYCKPFVGISIGKTECDYSYCRDGYKNYGISVGYSINQLVDLALDTTRTDLDSINSDEVRTDIINFYPKIKYNYNEFIFYSGMGLAIVKQNNYDFRALSVNVGAKYIVNDCINFIMEYDLFSNVDGKYNINDISLFKLGLEYSF